jgi:eukaryotic-like serine/threonine-protein kinase
MLLECLTGYPEYTGTTVETALARLARPPRIPDTLPSGWRALLSAMTVQDPESRPNAAQCAESLNAIVDGCPDAVVPLPQLSQPSQPSEDEDTPDRPPPVTAELARSRRPRARAVHGGLTALALAAACVAVAAPPTTAIPGQPSGLPHEQRATNTADTRTVTETVSPAQPTTDGRQPTAEDQDNSPSTAGTSTAPSTTQTTSATTTTTSPGKGNGKGNGGGASKTNSKKNGQN